MACLGLLEERTDRHDAGVVDQHVDVTRAVGAGLVEERRERVLVGDVERIAGDLPELRESGDRGLEHRDVAVADDHACTAGQ